MRALVCELEYLKSIGIDYIMLPGKGQGLEGLIMRIRGCRRCAHLFKPSPVPPAGTEGAKVVFVAPMPAKKDALFSPEQNELFCKIVRAMELDEGDYHITAILKCHVKEEVAGQAVSNCLEYLNEELRLTEPLAIVTLGGLPLKVLTQEDAPPERLTGRFYQYMGIRLMPVVDPGTLLEKKELKRDCWNALKKVMALYR